jgi:hypothetical protein
VYFKELDKGTKEDVRRLIDTVYNNVSDVKDLYAEMAEAIEKTVVAIKVRWYKEGLKPVVMAATDDLEGDYPMKADEKLFFRITKDPVAILAKSTSQCWENKSCEKLIRGEYGKGSFSDIANSNLVCFVIDKSLKDLPVARMMIRWCLTDAGKVDFGIEKKWYYCTVNPRTSNKFTAMGISDLATSLETRLFGSNVSLRKATAELVSIIRSKGFMKGYDRCTTPYVYGGYSDTKGNAKVKITYKSADQDE